MTSEQQITPWTFYGQLQHHNSKQQKKQQSTQKHSLNLSHSTPNKPIKSPPQINPLIKDHTQFLQQINLLTILKIIKQQLHQQSQINHQKSQNHKSSILELPKLTNHPQKNNSLPGTKLHIQTKPLKTYLLTTNLLKSQNQQFYSYSPKLFPKKNHKNSFVESVQTQPNKQFNDFSIIQVMQKIQKNNHQNIPQKQHKNIQNHQNKNKMFWYGKKQKINQLIFYLPQ